MRHTCTLYSSAHGMVCWSEPKGSFDTN